PSARDGLVIARAIGHEQWIAAAGCIVGQLHADLGGEDTARRELESALAQAREIASLIWTRCAASWLASTLARSGDLDAAAAILAEHLSEDTPHETIPA